MHETSKRRAVDRQHRFQVEHVRGEGREIGGNGLFIADIHQQVIKQWEESPSKDGLDEAG